MRTLAALFVAVAIALYANDAQAGGRRWARARYVHSVQADVVLPHPAPIDARVLYPKYQGGFHSRALQNIGVPSGDVGIRGNGFMMNPW